MRDERITANMIMEMLKDEELQRGGIFQKEEYYMHRYGFSLHEISMIQSAMYMIMSIDSVEDFDIHWK